MTQQPLGAPQEPDGLVQPPAGYPPQPAAYPQQPAGYPPQQAAYQPVVAARTQKVNAIAYLIVTFLVGVFGVHRFWRGQIGLGILYLLTGGLFGIGVLVDFILAIVWLTQMDPNSEITFINKKYARYQG